MPDSNTSGRRAGRAAAPDDPFAGLTGLHVDAAEPRESEGERARQRRRRRVRRRRRAVVLAAGAVLIVAVLIIGWVGIANLLGGGAEDYSGSGNGTEVDFTVREGDTGTAIGERLAEADIVASAEAFVEEVIGRDPEPTFLPGTFGLQEQMSAEAAVDALTDEANRKQSSFVVPEGTIMTDIFAIIEHDVGIPVAELEAAAADVASFGLPPQATTLEGFLFPAMYEFGPGVDARTVLETMVNRAFQSLDEAGVAPENRWDVIRLASIIEREAGLREDFYKVSRVFLNRLEIGMLLQSDATVTYGTGNTHRASTTDAERADASNPYNTYVHPGMVPAPISNPGDLAIDAAMNPAEGEWLYFVTVNLETGETVFSNTYEEHLVAVDQWLAWLAENPEYS